MLHRFLLFLLLTSMSLTAIGCPSGGRTDDDDSGDDDDSANVNPGGDADGDGFCLGDDECDDEDLTPGDCDDNDGSVNPDAEEACDAKDNDCDGRVDENFDADGDGYVTVENPECVGTYPPEELDCNDLIGAINPAAEETCDGNDTNCDGLIDNGLDQDFDGFRICDAPADCDDEDPQVYPGAAEDCNEEDDNCDGLIDNGLEVEFQDQDLDGFTPCQGDCDDDPVSGFVNYPGAQEGCDDIDNDCDGDVDEDLDLDGDGSPGQYPGCLQEYGEVDCDDTDATVFPSNAEICGTIDNNCNGQIAENLDCDGDGFTSCQGDCASLDAAVNPGATEACNGIDDNCDGVVDEGFDGDGDGQSACAGDCDDALATVYLGAPELCDTIDNDCDGVVGANETDVDGDTYSECDGDCDETDVAVNPGATESCNAIDDDCDGVVPADEDDADLDGFITCTPPGCSVALVADSDDATYFDSFTALDALGLDTVVSVDAEVSGVLGDAANFSDSRVILWATGYRELSSNEYDELISWIGAGNGLIVTGEGVLYEEFAAGDDDDSAAGDDDDSAASTDVDATLMADLIGSLTTGLGPETDACTVSNASTPVTTGPYGVWGTSYAFTASSTVHDNAFANTGAGAVRVASVGSRAKIIWRPVIGGGVVAYWNGNVDMGDWADADQGAMLRNIVSYMNSSCNVLQGGDCDDADPNAYPGTCP
ncbi:MAG: putative metal-binding motif-containing protein [Deltaproteobacteria bacterium]|nr:putative metal-binding motif-containing protein [Deltaproteobacteria bacterium]